MIKEQIFFKIIHILILMPNLFFSQISKLLNLKKLFPAYFKYFGTGKSSTYLKMMLLYRKVVKLLLFEK